MAVSTVLSCANPKEAANMSIEGEYEVSVITEAGNKEHPELEWNQVMQNNPLTDKVIEQFSNLDGVKKVEPFSYIAMSNEDFLEGENDANLTGMPETYAKKLEDGLVEGHITYEEMKNSNKVILNADLLHWYPDLSVGDNLDFQYMDGDVKKEVTLEIAAIGNYPVSLVDFADFITAQEFVEQLSQNNCYDHLAVFSEEKHNAALEKQIEELCQQTGGLELTRTWQSEYITWKQGISFVSTGCYLFLGVLGLICIMNLINTMINSIHMRKRAWYHAGHWSFRKTVNPYAAFRKLILYCRSSFMFCRNWQCGRISDFSLCKGNKDVQYYILSYHYPVTAVIGIVLAMALLQLLLVTVIGKSMKRESLMDRIRFSE